MTEPPKQWEGQVVNGKFPLRQYLGGSERSAVFLTEYGERELQQAAIKLIPADSQNAKLQLSRWKRTAKLSHPHLIRIFQVGRCRLGSMELLYLVMEYAEEDLSQVLPDRPLTPEEAREMLVPTLDALAFLHSNGFVHGHLKPVNIMAVKDQLKISSDELCRMDESSEVPGNPGVYAPPEIANGGISPAGDVWSLGMTLVEVLTQRLPVWETTVPGELKLPETVPMPFRDFALRCLRWDPRRRWTVADFAARLRGASASSCGKWTVADFTARLREAAASFYRQWTVADFTARLREAAASFYRQWTVADFTARLREALASSYGQMIVKSLEAAMKWRYFRPAAAVGLVLVGMLAVSQLLNRRPEAQQEPSVGIEQPRVQAETEGVPAIQPESEAEAETPSGGVVPGEVVDEVLPNVPQSASDTIQGRLIVRVRLRVDPLGSVVGAEFDTPGPSQYFARLSMQAAQQWKFQPAQVDGRNVSSEWILRFEYTNTATRAFSVQRTP